MGGVGPGKMSKHELFIQGSGKPAGWRGYFPEAAGEGKPGRTWKQKAWQLSSRAGPSHLPISGILAGRAWTKSSIFPHLYLSLVPENPPASPDVTDLAVLGKGSWLLLLPLSLALILVGIIQAQGMGAGARDEVRT